MELSTFQKKLKEIDPSINCEFVPGNPRSFKFPGSTLKIWTGDNKYQGVCFSAFPNNCGSVLMDSFLYLLKTPIFDNFEEIITLIGHFFNVGGIITVLGEVHLKEDPKKFNIEKLFEVGFIDVGSYSNPVHKGRLQHLLLLKI